MSVIEKRTVQECFKETTQNTYQLAILIQISKLVSCQIGPEQGENICLSWKQIENFWSSWGRGTAQHCIQGFAVPIRYAIMKCS